MRNLHHVWLGVMAQPLQPYYVGPTQSCVWFGVIGYYWPITLPTYSQNSLLKGRFVFPAKSNDQLIDLHPLPVLPSQPEKSTSTLSLPTSTEANRRNHLHLLPLFFIPKSVSQNPLFFPLKISPNPIVFFLKSKSANPLDFSERLLHCHRQSSVASPSTVLCRIVIESPLSHCHRKSSSTSPSTVLCCIAVFWSKLLRYIVK